MSTDELKDIMEELEHLNNSLELFKFAWNDLNDTFINLNTIDCNDYIALNDFEGNNIYPFHLSFDDMNVNEWVDCCSTKIENDLNKIKELIYEKENSFDIDEKQRIIDITTYFSLKYDGDFNSIYSAILNKEFFDKQQFKEMIENIKFDYVNIFSDDYPSLIREKANPPFCIFISGNKEILNSKDADNLEMDHFLVEIDTENVCRFTYILNEIERDDDKIYYDYVLLSESHDKLEDCICLMKTEINNQHYDSGYEACFIDDEYEEILELHN